MATASEAVLHHSVEAVDKITANEGDDEDEDDINETTISSASEDKDVIESYTFSSLPLGMG